MSDAVPADGTAPNGNTDALREALFAAAVAAASQSDSPETRAIAERIIAPQIGALTGDDVAIEQLARLPALDYERARTAAAEKLQVRTSILDRLVTAARGTNGEAAQGSALQFEEIEPWPAEVSGAQLLDELAGEFARFIALPPRAAEVFALWTLHAHAFQCFAHSPRLNITAPEKGCGKTLVLDVLSRFVPRALRTESVTTAVLFRLVDAHAPTLLIDECDAGLRDNDELRAALNAGFQRGGKHLRCEGDQNKVRGFRTFAPVALAGIGALPATLADRSIQIRMQRATKTESAALQRLDTRHTTQYLTRMAARWTADNAACLEATNPTIPDGLFNRKADVWRPLFAVADIAGADWPAKARAAAMALAGADDDGVNVELLRDVRAAFESEGTDRLSSADLIKALCADAEKRWKTFDHGREMTQRQLASRLRGFGAVSKPIRFADGLLRGYEILQFQNAFTRYLPDTTFPSVTALQAAPVLDSGDFPKRNNETMLRIEKTPEAAPALGCHAVTDKKSETGNNDDLRATGWVLEP
jgi:putative DNA primase/helicase